VGEASRAHGRRPLWRLLVVAGVVVGLLGLDGGTAEATHTVEHRYEVTGGFPVTWDDGSPDDCDGGASDIPASDPYTLVYPSPPVLGSLGDHPVVLWGNPSNLEYDDPDSQKNTTCGWQSFLRLLASWGFVVVAFNDGQVGSGDEMVFGAAAMINENNNPASVFYQKLDTASMAAAGHSQGAVAAINATLNSDYFESVLAISIPDREDLNSYNFGCFFTAGCVQVPFPAQGATNNLGVPIFFARNTGLYLPNTDPCDEDDWISDKTAADWYPAAPRPMLAGTVHATRPADPADCVTAWPHLNLTDAFGYMNAWLAYTLQNHANARPAFTGVAPQFMSNPDWEGRTIRGLT
jgi:hypothetical protein